MRRTVYTADHEAFRETLAAMPEELPLHEAVHHAVVAFNDYDARADPPHRERMHLIMASSEEDAATERTLALDLRARLGSDAAVAAVTGVANGRPLVVVATNEAARQHREESWRATIAKNLEDVFVAATHMQAATAQHAT